MASVTELEALEKNVCNLPSIFAEMFKDEINANEEHKLYQGIKRIIKKYSQDSNTLSVINEFTGVISGGATLEEILLIARDEAVSPTPASEMTVDSNCKLDEKR